MLCRVSVAVAAVDSSSGGLAMVYFLLFLFSFQFPLFVTLPGFFQIFLSISSFFKYPEAVSCYISFLILCSLSINVLFGMGLSPLAATMYQ